LSTCSLYKCVGVKPVNGINIVCQPVLSISVLGLNRLMGSILFVNLFSLLAWRG
jgi:hypothetical protein